MLTVGVQLWDVCSDQEAVDLVRKQPDAQVASKMLVDHALQRFSTDNLSVMVVRFHPQKVKANVAIDIGVQHDARDKVAISEAEMIVNEARRNSGIPVEGNALTAEEEQELRNMVIEEQDEDGPEVSADKGSVPVDNKTMESGSAVPATGEVGQEDLKIPEEAKHRGEVNAANS